MFLDLHDAVGSLTACTVLERVVEFASKYPGIAIVAIGGFPVTGTCGSGFRWVGNDITPEFVADQVNSALGLSAVLTYMNRKRFRLSQLGELCTARDHDWGLRWVTVSLVFSGLSDEVEWAFARDGRFRLSWPVVSAKAMEWPSVFVASASVHDWRRFLKNRGSADFSSPVRAAMVESAAILERVGMERAHGG